MVTAKLNYQELTIVVTLRVSDDKTSLWEWALYDVGGVIPLARSEYQWNRPASAKAAARKFLKATGLKTVTLRR